MTKKNPFYWDTKKMHSVDKESAWEDTKAMRRIGRKRFDELFRTEFNGMTVLIIPRDLKKVTLADLATMYDSDIRFSRGFHKKHDDVWCVSGHIRNWLDDAIDKCRKSKTK